MSSKGKPPIAKFLALHTLSRKDSQLLVPCEPKPAQKSLIKSRIKSLTKKQSVSTPASPEHSPRASTSHTSTFLTSSRTNDSFSPAFQVRPDPTVLSSPHPLPASPIRVGHQRSRTEAEARPQPFKHFAIQPHRSPAVRELPNVVTRCAFKTRTGAILSRPKKHNQDAYIIVPLLGQVKGQYLFAVCDGHGANGHLVSRLIKESLPALVGESLSAGHQDAVERLSLALMEGYRKTVSAAQRSKIDITLSGSTCVSVAISGRSLVCANVGDSRAILVRQSSTGWEYETLSTDHKPSLATEYQRIIASGGRVSPHREASGDPIGPARVWLAHKDLPGLAMSRAIGDSLAAQAGVISVPELKSVSLCEKDKALVLGSDGLWEFLSNQEVAEVVGTHLSDGDLEGTCEQLVKEAVRRWRKEDGVVDDITLIVVYLSM